MMSIRGIPCLPSPGLSYCCLVPSLHRHQTPQEIFFLHRSARPPPLPPILQHPRVGPTFSNNPVYESTDFIPVRKPLRFSLLLGFLPGNISDRVRGAVPHNPDPTSQASPSSSIFAFKRKKQSRASSSTTASSASAFRRKHATDVSNRGMSLAGASDHEEDRKVDGRNKMDRWVTRWMTR
ncbi:hypothetical protein MLD38_007200 [Melastoma candidum]|uniref:Uncharacterized protein n=1 Tax=Melastoma candidum TaxID=119954 RepID=A0ACB9RPV1_9MYRT|nr:hypothetical protein MLD38_007200 [Melastoma candidum]